LLTVNCQQYTTKREFVNPEFGDFAWGVSQICDLCSYWQKQPGPLPGAPELGRRALEGLSGGAAAVPGLLAAPKTEGYAEKAARE